MITLVPSSQVCFDSDQEAQIIFQQGSPVSINNMTLEINCGFNMYSKKLQIILMSEKNELELPEITLSQMYKLQIAINRQKMDWNVTSLIIRPCQKNNHPIFIAVLSAEEKR
jgi:hypothetical protein